MRNGNEACLTTNSMKSGHRSKVKVVLALLVPTLNPNALPMGWYSGTMSIPYVVMSKN